MDIEEIMENNDLRELLELLLHDGFFQHETEIAIAKKIIDKDVNGLTGGQVDVYRDFIQPKLENANIICKRCQVTLDQLPFSNKYLLMSTGYCSDCDNRLAKDDK